MKNTSMIDQAIYRIALQTVVERKRAAERQMRALISLDRMVGDLMFLDLPTPSEDYQMDEAMRMLRKRVQDVVGGYHNLEQELEQRIVRKD